MQNKTYVFGGGSLELSPAHPVTWVDETTGTKHSKEVPSSVVLEQGRNRYYLDHAAIAAIAYLYTHDTRFVDFARGCCAENRERVPCGECSLE